MRNKSRILEMLKDAPEDIKKLTVAELIERLTKDQEKTNKEELHANNKVIEEFTGVYIKIRDEDAAFGVYVDYIRINENKNASLVCNSIVCI